MLIHIVQLLPLVDLQGEQPTLRSPTFVGRPATSVLLPVEHRSPLEKKTAKTHLPFKRGSSAIDFK